MHRSEMLRNVAALSERLASAAETDRSAAIRHCPGWTMTELVGHVGMVQGFWSDVIEQGITNPDDVRRPTGIPTEGDPVHWLREQSARLLRELTEKADETPIWTWWASSQNVGFVVRRQLIEVTTHCWDAEEAVGRDVPIAVEVAVIGLEEFAEVMSRNLRSDHPAPPVVDLAPSDSRWRGSLFAATASAGDALSLGGTASEMLLTLWGRGLAADPAIAEALAAVDLS